MDLQVSTRLIEDEVYLCEASGGQMMTIDMRDQEKKANQSPMEALLSAVSACSAVDIMLMLRKKRKTINDLKITATGKRQDDPPRFFNNIHLEFHLWSPDTKQTELEKVVNLTIDKYCSVASTVDGKANITRTCIIHNEDN